MSKPCTMFGFISTYLPLRSPSRTYQSARCGVDTEAPPQSRYAKYYPAPTSEAPYVNVFNAPQMPLVNNLGVVREEVPLDLEKAAALLAQARATQATRQHDPSQLFGGPTKDNFATDAVDRYYPQFRRNEAPLIEITAPGSDDEDGGSVTITLGSIIPTPPPEYITPKLPTADHKSFWNQGEESGASPTVNLHFGKARRNLAPVITFAPGRLALSVGMQAISGEPSAEKYAERFRCQAPNIKIRKPLGEWDKSGFVQVSMDEVQLPLIEAATLKHE